MLAVTIEPKGNRLEKPEKTVQNIAHHVKLGTGCFLSQGTNVGASISIGERAFIGIGSTIMTGINSVGNDVIIGAGSVLIKDAPDFSVMVGNPARVIRQNNEK